MNIFRIFGNKVLKKEINVLNSELAAVNLQNALNNDLANSFCNRYEDELEKRKKLEDKIKQLENELKASDAVSDIMLEIQEREFNKQIESISKKNSTVRTDFTQVNQWRNKYEILKNTNKELKLDNSALRVKVKSLKDEIKKIKKENKKSSQKEVVVRSKVINPNQQIFKRYIHFVEKKDQSKQKLDNFEYLVLNYQKLPSTKKVERIDGNYNRQSFEKALPNEMDDAKWEKIMTRFDQKCALSGLPEELSVEHFIPVSTGHGGLIEGNVFPLNKRLNYSKSNRNPFYWFSKNDFPVEISLEAWEELISYLADANGLSVPDYIDFVNWCFENPRTVEQIKADGDTSSLTLWKKHTRVLAKAN